MGIKKPWDRDALDAISDMTLILMKKIKNLNDIQKFKYYSQSILVNCSHKIIKSRKLVLQLDDNIQNHHQNDLDLLDLY